MGASNYAFLTRWTVEADVREVAEVLGDAPGLKRWWPSVYLDVKELAPGDRTGVGRRIELWTKGWLPYTLRWQFMVTEVTPEGFTLEADGDFVGRGVRRFTQQGSLAEITYDWRIRADKPLLRYFSFLFKPMFAANHRWAMRMGEESLRLELARRHARTPEERAAVPPPPAPTPSGNAGFLAFLLRSGRRR